MSDEYLRKEILDPDGPGPGESQLEQIQQWIRDAEKFVEEVGEKLLEAGRINWTNNYRTSGVSPRAGHDYVEFLTRSKKRGDRDAGDGEN